MGNYKICGFLCYQVVVVGVAICDRGDTQYADMDPVRFWSN